MSIQITIFDLATGEIKRRVACQDIDVHLQIGTGEGYINGDVDDAAFVIVNGVPAPKPPPDPALVLANARANMNLSPWQVRQVLNQLGLRSAVEAYVTTGTSDIQDAWHYASVFNRMDAFITSAATALSLTDLQLDDAFTLGATL
jgi:hypothetical protein